MKTKRRNLKKRKTQKNKKQKKWTTALDAAQAALKKTGSLASARAALKFQAAKNARRLFGAV